MKNRLKNFETAGRLVGVLLLGSTVFLAGCQSTTPLMPTPNLYAWGNFNPFENVPPELQNNHVDVLYFTDRVQKLQHKPGISTAISDPDPSLSVSARLISEKTFRGINWSRQAAVRFELGI